MDKRIQKSGKDKSPRIEYPKDWQDIIADNWFKKSLFRLGDIIVPLLIK